MKTQNPNRQISGASPPNELYPRSFFAIREIQNALFTHQTAKAIKLLDEHKLPPDTTAHNGLTFLMYATQQNNFSAVIELIKRGADVNYVNDESRVPALWFAFTTAKNLELANYLLENGSVTEMRYCDRDNLLDWLNNKNFKQKYINQVKELLSKYSKA